MGKLCTQVYVKVEPGSHSAHCDGCLQQTIWGNGSLPWFSLPNKFVYNLPGPLAAHISCPIGVATYENLSNYLVSTIS